MSTNMTVFLDVTSCDYLDWYLLPPSEGQQSTLLNLKMEQDIHSEC